MKNFKIVLLTSAAIFSTIVMYGQPKDASVMIDRENRNAVMIVIDQPDNITRDALKQRMERSGLKEREKNGVVSYKGVTLSEISIDKLDIYTKVEKGPNNSSVVYMAVSRGYNNFTNTTVDSNINQNVKTFLQSLAKAADNQFADVEIGKQVTNLSNDEKMYQRLLNEQRDLQQKKSTIDNRLTAIQAELNTRMEELNKKKSGLEDARTKRSNMK